MPLQTQSRFFLTRQTATILEDLYRRLNKAGSISLLHGARGIGKSRLLRQFFENRLSHEDAVLVQFDSNNSFVVNTDKKFAVDTFFDQIIANLKTSSTLLVDQFDNAPVELQQKIVKFWSVEGLDKSLKLVISVQRNSLQQLKDLSRRFHLQIESVELKPLSSQEQLEYLRSSCCPEIRQVAAVSPKLKKNLKLTNGLFSQLEAFRSQYRDEIICQEISVSSRVKLKNFLLSGFAGLLILALALFVFQNDRLNTELSQAATTSIPENNPVQLNPPKIVTAKIADLHKEEAPEDADKSMVDVDSITIADEIGEDPVSDQSQKEHRKSKERLVKTVEDVPQQVSNNIQKNPTAFQQRLLATKNWLDSAHKKSASIQIMTIS
ncbi:MAG: ATP-binding protein, partial [Gammaproteobacteria bacterium]|nr:ATP-binding protein [Gammaproteobacteria bacterium]